MGTAKKWLQAHDLHFPDGSPAPFSAAIRSSGMAMVIVDPDQHDDPIIFANDAFLKLTGYERHEVTGRNCRFLQGPGTDAAARQKIRAAIESNSEIAIDLLNYRKDGSSFWNSLYLSPVFDESGERQYFFASQFDVSERKKHEIEAIELRGNLESLVKSRTQELEQALHHSQFLLHEVDHRVKNNLQMISAILMLQSMTIADAAAKRTLQEMLARVDALGLVHKRLYQSGDITEFDIGEFTRDIVGHLTSGSRQKPVEVELDIASVQVKASDAASLALVINEALTAALESQSDAGARRLAVNVAAINDQVEIFIRHGGTTAEPLEAERRFRKMLVETLARQLHATVDWNADGTSVKITMPRTEPEPA